MILSPRASYVTFEDNRETDGYTICRQCKYHLCRVEIPTMACANNNMYRVPPKYLRDLSHIEAAFISPVRSYGYVFTYMGRKQWQLKGVLSYYKVEMESIARSALHFEIVGMEKHIVTLLYGPMTAEQKSSVKQKSTICPTHVLRALKWLVKYNTEWKERNINLSKIRDSLQQPVVIDSTYAVNSEDSNVETTESFEVFFPDGSMTELTGGQENINKFKDLVAENVRNGYNLEFRHKVEKTACFDYMENNFVNACILQFPYGRGGFDEL